MSKRFLMPLLATIIVIAMVLTGCPTALPVGYFLEISSSSGGSVTTPGEGSYGPYQPGDVIDLDVMAEAGWTFSKWLGATAGIAAVTEGQTTITISADAAIVAQFDPDVEPAPAGWEPVTLKLLIRTEDERRGMGDYFGDLMEQERFKTDRLYRTGTEAAPIWQATPPAYAGAWHMYTGGWVSTLVSRDESGDFFWFYCGVWGWGPYGAQTPDPEFYDVCEKLNDADYADMAERRELFQKALFMASEDSSTVHTVTVTGFNPWHRSVNVAPDMSAGVYGSRYWGYTLHKHNMSGANSGVPIVPTGTTNVRIAMPSIVTNPWNPIDGSNWVYDMMPIRAAGDAALLPHPITGFWLPQRLDSAAVTVQKDLPMVDKHPVYGDWLTLQKEEVINVPATAWVDWSVTNKEFITRAQKENAASPYYDADWAAARGTALLKSVVVYESDVYANKWHDGSNMALADFVMNMIYPYERGREGGLFHDPARYGWTFSSWYSQFRGVEILNTNPLTIATYTNVWTIDPCWSVTTWWPFYAQGSAAWHNLALGILAEADGTGAFSSRKAAATAGAEWLNYVYGTLETAGPPLLKTYLDAAIATPTSLPYYSFFLAQDPGFATQAPARLANLNAWYAATGNFWQGTGPLRIDSVSKALNQVEMSRNPFFKDSGAKWLEFCEFEVVGPIPNHTGAWVDKVFFSQLPQISALSELNSNAIDLYAFSISDGELFFDVLPTMANIRYMTSYGSWSELLLNPVLDFDDGMRNPFGDPEIREALQWLIDRDTIADEVYGGMGEPKYTLLTDVFPEASERYPDIMAAIRAKYASDPSKASGIISNRMSELGFKLYYSVADGRALWHWNMGS